MKLERKKLFSFNIFSSHPVGMFLSHDSIRYIEGTEDNKIFKIKQYGEIVFPDGSILHGKINNENIFKKVLSEYRKDKDFKKVRLVLPYQDINMATMEYYRKILQNSGISVISIENEGDAIINSIVNDNGVHFFVSIENHRVYCMYVVNRKVLYYKIIHGSGNSYIEYVAREVDVPFDIAEGMIKSYGLDRSFTSKKFSHAVFFGVSFFSEQINNCIIECNTNKEFHGGGNIQHITLFGEDATLVDFKDYLAQSLHVSVSHANVWKKIKHKMNDVPEISFDESLAYLPAFGAIVGDFN
jgi:Tfp pilus assembly PilM family ATPase